MVRQSATSKKLTKVIGLVGILIVGVVIACAVYLGDYYRADMERIENFTVENSVEMQISENGDIIFVPEEATTGFIFYPGGKVEYTAYIPLMKELASEGILCVLVEMPFNLAVLDSSAAEGIPEQYPEIEDWYIGGHSLGGSMAASYLSECAEAFDGLILLGSYSTADLSDADVSVLSVYGSEDLVMNREKYDENKTNLPDDFEEVILEGGCHAYFGMYGSQEGDGVPLITNEEQIRLTEDVITTFIVEDLAVK